MVWINGYGWPVYRGGPMFYGDTIGLEKVLAKMKEFGAKMGEDFTLRRCWKSSPPRARSFQRSQCQASRPEVSHA